MLGNDIERLKEYSGRRFHVIGIGRSGVGVANLLDRLGADVSISDIKDREQVDRYLNHISDGIGVFTERQDKGLISDIESLVLSPGVPGEIDIVEEAIGRSIEVTGEIELSYRIIKLLSERAGFRVRWFGITGTNGKSTTTTLLYEMLKKEGRDCSLSGNIGYPLSNEAIRLIEKAEQLSEEMSQVDIVLELSSFQLELIKDLSLGFSALLNVTSDHLDRYRDIDHYAEAKSGIFMNQGANSFAVINSDDRIAVDLSNKCRAKKYYVSTMSEVKGAYAKDGSVYINMGDNPELLISSDEIRIAGLHNLYNSLVAALLAYLAGVAIETIASVLTEFPGLEHRLEFVAEKNGVHFYNDSKGTNVGAVIKSLESFEKNVILIAGGRDKNGDFRALAPFVKERVKKIVVIGEAASNIQNALQKVVPVENAISLREAVSLAYDSASPGDTVLLSPACASFDMFRDYEDRGRKFKELTNELLRGN
ncbi:MAG: UDP-N-acetylmuramoyl-L-alanine--D-glutamate ligase [Thermodesulfovibrionales bacterium]